MMSSRSMDDLIPEFRFKAREIVDRCKDRGFELRIYCTLRTAEEQARLYRQSRKLVEVETKEELLRIRGYDFLADILINVGPQYGIPGRHVTNAGPGESWHQYGRAFDAVPMRGGKCLWEDYWPEWDIYGETVKAVGLNWAGSWTRFREFPHTQDSPTPNPLHVYGVNQVLDILIREES